MLYIVSIDYDEELDCVILKLYDTETETIINHYDMQFKAYFLSERPLKFEGIVSSTPINKYDALHDVKVGIWQNIVTSPSIIKKLNYEIQKAKDANDIFPEVVWENYIKLHQSYIYDNAIEVSMPYVREVDGLMPHIDRDAEERALKLTMLVNPSTENELLCAEIARLLEYPAPNFKRISLDIEVINEGEVMPDPDSANLPIIMVGLQTLSGEKHAFILLQENKKFTEIKNVGHIRFFSNEKELLEALFDFLKSYPCIVTFNGDEFDLPYIRNRALRLGIPSKSIPIKIVKRVAYWQNAIHIDLYKFFKIRAMMIYAFSQKYKTVDLDTVSKALLDEGKHPVTKWVGDMSYDELATYCSKDAELSMRLTTYNNNLVMNLILILSRLAHMPIEDVSRKSISNWIRSMVYYEHRKHDILIPRSEDILIGKGQTMTTALVKGKKYKGAVVVTPKAGVYFNTKVGDFASLYPSIMKKWKLGYSTVNCPHEDCKDNRVAEMSHWICKKQFAIESQLIGTLKDLRVLWYKKRGKDKEEPRKEWYGVAEQSIKVICNAAYGVFGDDEFSLYCPPFAEYVTGIGRYIITQTIEHAQSLGLTVLYGDTDSIFIDKPDKAKLEQLLIWTKETFDIDFELEKHYRYVCLSDRKKNYFGVLENGDIDVKGLTAKKKHTPKIFKDVFAEAKKILTEIEKPEDVPIKKEELLKLIKNTYTILRHKKWKNIQDLAFHVTLSKNIDEYDKTEPQHIKASKILQNKGYQVSKGIDISYVKTTTKERVKPTILTKSEEVDVSKYIEFLRNTFVQILEPLGIIWDRDILGLCRMDQFCYHQP